MPELERALAELAAELAWPATPDLAARVLPRLGERRGSRWWFGALAAAAALGAAAAAATATNDVLHTVSVVRVSALPSAPATPTEYGTPEPNLGAAARSAGIQLAAPSALPPPNKVYSRTAPRSVTLLYAPGGVLPPSPVDPSVGALVVEGMGSQNDPLIAGKLVGPGTTVSRVDVAGATGIWIEGAPHEVFLDNQPDTLRLATNTLLWYRAGVTYRLEAHISEEEALRIAESFQEVKP